MSYLYDWFQKVSVNNMQSDTVKLSCGVPHNSVLGPVFFTLYTTHLASIITSHNLNHHFYADNTNYLTAPYWKTSTLFWKWHLLFGHQTLDDTKQTSTK